MGTTLSEYCETSKSKFAEALKVALRNAVFIRADEITIGVVEDYAQGYIDVMHTLTKTDIELMISIFDGLDWQIGTTCYQCTYRVIFYLTPGWL